MDPCTPELHRYPYRQAQLPCKLGLTHQMEPKHLMLTSDLHLPLAFVDRILPRSHSGLHAVCSSPALCHHCSDIAFKPASIGLTFLIHNPWHSKASLALTSLAFPIYTCYLGVHHPECQRDGFLRLLSLLLSKLFSWPG